MRVFKAASRVCGVLLLLNGLFFSVTHAGILLSREFLPICLFPPDSTNSDPDTVSTMFTDTVSLPADSLAKTDSIAVKNLKNRENRRRIQVVNLPDSTSNTTDPIEPKKHVHSPTKALLWSIIPGGGQIYNRKWWKLPIIYAGLSVGGYFIVTQAMKTQIYSNEFFFREYGATEYYNPDLQNYSSKENIVSMRNYYRRNMEIAIGISAIFYALNLIDALVDAHLYDFDISDDLSLRVLPFATTLPVSGFAYYTSPVKIPCTGISLQLHF